MTTAGAVLDVARSQIGTRENVKGQQKYGAAYGMDGVAWCNQFVWWCFTQAGAADLTPKSAYTPSTYAWYRGKGAADRNPRPGDLAFYDWPDSIPRIQHVGFVEAVNADGTITTIEGNTTSGAAGNQSAGGGVYRRRRSQSAVVGYGHPAYTAPPAPPAGPSQDGSQLPTLTYGTTSEAVRGLQRWLNAYPWNPELPLLNATGNYLGQTQGVVRRAQAQCGVTGPDADGSIVGPRTNRAFWARGYRG